MKKLSFLFAALLVGSLCHAGKVVEWDSTKTTGDWSVGGNWIGGEVPTDQDAAKFTVPQGEQWIIGIDCNVNVTNLWLYGGGTLKLENAGGESFLIWGDSDKAAYDSSKKVYNVGSGRQSVLVTEGSSLIVDGIAVTNAQKTTYHDLQMNNASTLVVTNGAEFVMPVRVPATGAGALPSDTFTIRVTGDGSKLANPGNAGQGTQIRGDGGRVICDDGGRIDGQLVWTTSPTDLVYSFTNASFYFNSTLKPAGENCKLELVNSSGESSNSLEAQDTLDGFQFIIRDGSEFKTTSFRWGYKLAKNNMVLVTNATLKLTGYVTMGANKGSETNHSKNNSIIIQKDGFFNCPNARQEFDVGWHSENDLLFIDGGRLFAKRTSRIGYQDCSGTVFKVRGETAEAEFDGTLSFDNKATLATELPLPLDRAVITCSDAVAVNDGIKFEVTVPEGTLIKKTQYTILTGKSITGMIEPENVAVKGKATAELVKSDDGKSLILTLKPRVGLLMIIR